MPSAAQSVAALAFNPAARKRCASCGFSRTVQIALARGQDGRTFKQGDFVREQPLGTRRAVADHGNAASHELERQQRQIGEGQDRADIALRVQGRQICQIDDAWIGMFERDFIAAQVRTGKHCDGVRVALGDFGEYQHAQFKRAPGGIWTRVEEDVLFVSGFFLGRTR